MDINNYQTGEEKELIVKLQNKKYLLLAIVVTLLSIYLSVAVGGLIVFSLTAGGLIGIIYGVSCILSMIYCWAKALDKHTKLLINSKGIAFSTTAFDIDWTTGLSVIFNFLKTLNNYTITKDGLGYKEEVFSWSELMAFYTVLNTKSGFTLVLVLKDGNKRTINTLELDKSVDQIKESLAYFSKINGIEDKGLVQKTDHISNILHVEKVDNEFDLAKKELIIEDVTLPLIVKKKSWIIFLNIMRVFFLYPILFYLFTKQFGILKWNNSFSNSMDCLTLFILANIYMVFSIKQNILIVTSEGIKLVHIWGWIKENFQKILKGEKAFDFTTIEKEIHWQSVKSYQFTVSRKEYRTGGGKGGGRTVIVIENALIITDKLDGHEYTLNFVCTNWNKDFEEIQAAIHTGLKQYGAKYLGFVKSDQ